MFPGSRSLACSLLIMCLGGFFTASQIQVSYAADVPLLQKGKRTLYQRVISHPEARLAQQPGEEAKKSVRAFTPFYVYERRESNGEEWLKVSTSNKGQHTAWIKASETSPWDKALTLVFADRMGRDPALFFKSFSDLNRLVSSENIRLNIDRLIQNVGQGNSPIIASEPRDEAVPHKKFYLMPVFNYSDEYEQYNLRLLNVGIIDPGSPKSSKINPPKQSPITTSNFAAGLAFIIDTTISMGPYIEQTKHFIHEAYNSLEHSTISKDVAFAVVGYRNSTKFDPRLEYISTVVSPFSAVGNRIQAERDISSMDEAKVSTHSFNEDAFAAIKTSIDTLDWSPYAVKMAVLVTDAGAIRSNDPYSSTGMNENEMADLLAQKGIRLVVIHLQTQSGKKHNLNGVIRQYKRLTSVRDGNVKSTYLPLPVKGEAATKQFSQIAGALVDVLQKIVLNTAKGEGAVHPTQPPSAEVTPETSARYLAECLGYSAYLEFAGQKKKVSAPSLVEAWVADKDLDALSQGKTTDSLIPCVLLNKMQLDALAKQIGILVDAARATKTTDSRGLFQRIISLSSQVVRDPERMQGSSDANLCEQGLLPEFLQGLPYRSQVMNLNEQRWIAMSAVEQDELIASLSAKIRLYAEYHNDVDNWVRFEGADASEALYRVPLTSLP